jgi:hypothetical protein
MRWRRKEFWRLFSATCGGGRKFIALTHGQTRGGKFWYPVGVSEMSGYVMLLVPAGDTGWTYRVEIQGGHTWL